ncbi:ABC transporter ATP-binding protein [Chryseosolibacter indicus]|uniref:ATP-binding cassette domain-containing protein n=1 Tax=Chryseosolibacter indicus TaxID=2782351 RepID=A0ABS5VLW9_9BACT|nr:ATP-binding cassette domain-containing protein [Chryseosolibacter indicus]MBT1701767.1 ATP-binding cassette domain-containing protein [Chryseosolibacter indicus]
MLATKSNNAPAIEQSRTDNVVVSIRNLKKAFGDREILNGVDLDLHESENLVILGRSGTGKSVLIKCMVGLIVPDSGQINVLGRDVFTLSAREMNELRLQIGFSFQGSALYDAMTVRENLEFPLKRNLGIFEKRKLDEMVMTALDDVGLAHAVDQWPAELSGGMKKRIGIARTLILKPKIMLYDEPTAGLDPITSMEINELILSVREKYKTSSIIITHDISSARTTSDRIIGLINGKNKIEGTFEELKNARDPDLEPFFKY